MGFEQLELRAFTPAAYDVTGTAPCAVLDGHTLTVTGDGFAHTYDTDTGLFRTLSWNGNEMLQAPMSYAIWRAPTDNERHIRGDLTAQRYDRLQPRGYDTTWKCDGDTLLVNTVWSISGVSRQPLLTGETVWTVFADGTLEVAMNVEQYPQSPALPRFGLTLTLSRDDDRVRYRGRGPCENYCDKQHASWFGEFESTVCEQHEDYLFPQDNGNHTDCTYFAVGGLCAEACTHPLDCSVSPYTVEELTRAAHAFELVDSGMTVWHIDYRQSGVGSHSCGPKLAEQWELPRAFTFCARIKRQS